ncbi:MAG: zinc-binding dehydrogenase [Chloroflexi bacterium]|nr:zinc-binding dehydrogenase [Chloroflexota bacterium]MBP8054738.1 zinc-binding dehydrogenase [Chloroflexota bacterium]
MKAIVFYQHGNLDQVHYADVPAPEPGPNELLLAVKAAALNRLDLWVLEGWPALKLHLPHVMGSDGAGVIAGVGANVTGWQVGDRVAVNPTYSCGQCDFCLRGRDNLCDQFAIFGEHLPGFFADYAVVPARNLLRLPDHVTFADAAAASLVYVTAWHSLVERGRFQTGEDILIIGAGGGVNTATIQIARLAGARTIFVVGSDEAKLSQARELGADVTINRNQEEWSKAIFKATNRRGVDVVVDNVGAATYTASLRALKKGGRLLTVGNTSGPKIELDNRLMFGKHLEIIGSTMGPMSAYQQVMAMVFSGRLKPIIDTLYPLHEGATALNRLQRGDIRGKLVLEPA